jgi:hypothetical protein
MARFNVEIELDWLGEDESVDEAIIRGITDALMAQVGKRLTAQVEEALGETVMQAVDRKVEEVAETLLNNRFDITNAWGSTVARNTSVMEQLQAKLQAFLTEKVDSHDYRGPDKETRLDKLVRKIIDVDFKLAIDNAIGQVKTELEGYMKTEMRQQLGDKMARILDLDDLVLKTPKTD